MLCALQQPANRIASGEGPSDRGDLRTLARIQGVDHHAVADVDAGVRAVGDDIARLSGGERRNSGTVAGLCAGAMRQGDAELGEYVYYEVGAISAARSGPTPHIGHLAYELLGVGDQGGSGLAVRGVHGKRSGAGGFQ